MTTDFNSFGLPAKLLESLARMNFTTPTPIQVQAIPLLMEGKDVLGSAQTGTGKTGAFGIPLIAKLIDNPQATALVMTPTRELAAQVLAALQQMIPVPTIRTALLIGGDPMHKQLRQLQGNPRLIVGTPGRINDHLERGTVKFNNTRFLVLDETDRMLDMGFGIQIERIVAKIPAERQTMMFSATMPSDIVKLSSKYLTNYERISVGSTIEASPNIRQELVHTNDADKYARLTEQLESNPGSVIIFVKTKYGTEKLADKLSRANLAADAIHGDLRQARRDRVIQKFRNKEFRILVATDLAARGLDVPHIELVVNYDLPQCPEDYIHRIGRTARAGASGKAVNLLTSADRIKWNAIQRLMNPSAPRGGDEQRSEAPRRSYKPAYKKDGFKSGGYKQGGFKSEGRAPEGQREGYKPSGFKSEGRKPEGQRQEGYKPSGFKSEGRNPEGQRQDGYKPSGFKSEGRKPEGQRQEGYKPSGFKSEGRKPEGQRQEGYKPSSFKSEGHKAGGKPDQSTRRPFKQRDDRGGSRAA